MTRDEARAYFRDKGLTYDDITVTDLHFLSTLLNLQFTIQRKYRIQARRTDPGGAKPVYWLRVNDSQKFKGQYDEQGRMLCAYLTGKGSYFTAREVISFNRDGFIGFCGEADSQNTEPVLTAFVEWCDEMASIKEVSKHDGNE
jgi:hypothetical protein